MKNCIHYVTSMSVHPCEHWLLHIMNFRLSTLSDAFSVLNNFIPALIALCNRTLWLQDKDYHVKFSVTCHPVYVMLTVSSRLYPSDT